LKVKTVEGYLAAFVKALKNANFTTVYIDAFAGSGSFQFGAADAKGFIPAHPAIVHAGSAKRALAVRPAFDELHFIDIDESNAAALKIITAEHPAAKVYCEDANTAVRRICRETSWVRARGVIFLDPFNTVVEWKTLEEIAATKALDVWYLAPLAGIYRNAPHKHSDLTADKRRTVTRIYGTPDWEAEFYKVPTKASLFDLPPHAAMRVLDVAGIQAFTKKRLETVFSHVEPPRSLLGPMGAPLFSLFFAMSNPAAAAKRVALPIARHLLKAR
jgi:three-Cys-motif partner protein